MILGIDPGIHGALCFYEPVTDRLDIFDTPTHIVTVGKTPRALIDYYQLGAIISHRSLSVSLAVIEEVNAMPGAGGRKMGVTSAFRFGEIFGALQALCAMGEIPMELVKPSAWKRVMGLTADKDASRRRASQLFPHAADQWPRKKDADRAEATLLAVYGDRLLQTRHANR